MGKNKDLSINVVLFAISSFGTKFLAFFLVPFYTNYLSTSEYGTIDLIVNTASLFLPVFTLNIYESVMRFTIVDKNNSEYFIIGCRISAIGVILLAGILGVVHFASPSFISISSLLWIWAICACNAAYNTLANYMRATDKVPYMVQASLINSALMLTMNILFIAVLKMGVTGYFISMITGLVAASEYMFFRGVTIKTTKRINDKPESKVIREMLKYSIPLIFTAIAWWINSSLDRYFVTEFCGTDANGVYSIAYKIPNLLTSIQMIFLQAWAISAVTEFNKNDTDGFMGHTYELFAMIMLLACMGIMLLNVPFSKILYAKDFFAAWQYVPFLLISAFFGAMAGYFGGIFSAVKNSKICALSTIVSAIVNILLNAILIPVYGVSGAAVATLVAYFVSWLIRAIVVRKYVRLKVNNIRMFISICLLAVQLLCATSENLYYPVQVATILLVLTIYRKLIKEAVEMIGKKLLK